MSIGVYKVLHLWYNIVKITGNPGNRKENKMNETKSENYCLIAEDEFRKTQVEVAKEMEIPLKSIAMIAFLACYQAMLHKKLFPKKESEEKTNDLKE